jgi:hypothetical protein
MNHYFLSALADYYFNKYGTSISDFCFVFPSRRAGIFFRNHLATLSQKPLWSPSVLTINEFVEKLTRQVPADSITLIFKLYDVYCQVNESPLSFDEFLPWGEMLLSDFDDIDKYLADAAHLFSNLMSLKELEGDFTFLSDEQVEAIRTFWSSFNPDRLSEHQKKFIKNWESLLPLYLGFREKLRNEKIAYSGMMMRDLAVAIRQKDDITIEWPKVIFAGFFVLTPAEKLLFKYLKDQKKGMFFWDYSSWLMQEFSDSQSHLPIHLPFRDAAVFLRENITSFPVPDDWNLPLNGVLPEIEITGVASQTEQLRLVSSFLQNINRDVSQPASDTQALDTAVILTDENMLIPVLHAIPPQFDKINVTLGYPLKNTPIYSLIGAIIQLQRNARKTREGKTWFYFRDVLPVIQHQYIAAIAPDEAAKIKHHMLARNSIYVQADELCISDYFTAVFQKIEVSTQIPAYIEKVLFNTYHLVKQNVQSYFEQEFVFALYKSVVKLGDLLQKLDSSIQPQTWLKLFKRLTENQSVAFKGEPLSGLQVMGILETRAIDFENLVILNMNEGVFPKDSAPNTFIPYNLRKGFGLPTIEHQDAIFSYYFFRLIHRAKKIQLVFNSSSQGTQSGEMSRYLYQLIYEHPVQPVLKTAVEQVQLFRTPQVEAPKTDEVMEKLRALSTGEKALSPSAISTFIDCEMRFYYKYICKIDEPDEITEDLDARIFGILFHHAMETIYKPLINRQLSIDELEKVANDKVLIDSVLRDAFRKHFSELSLRDDEFEELQGKNILVFEVLKRYIRQVILNEKQHLPLVIKGLEIRATMPFTLENGITLQLGGIIDRVDDSKGTIRVLDYKTGSGKDQVAQLSDLFDPDKHKDVKAIFQTLLYCTVLSETSYAGRQVAPTVMWMKKLFISHDYSLKIGQRAAKSTLLLNDVKEEFQMLLGQLLIHLYDENEPFKQTAKDDKCKFCTYKVLCNK